MKNGKTYPGISFGGGLSIGIYAYCNECHSMLEQNGTCKCGWNHNTKKHKRNYKGGIMRG